MTKKVYLASFIIVAAAVLLPLSLSIITGIKTKGTNPIPPRYFAERVDSRIVDGKKVYDTIFHKVSDLKAVNQFGDEVSLNQDLKGKILVVDFFFADCPSVCPRLTGNMKLLQKAFKKRDLGIHLVSITVNPEVDTFQRLRDYADRFGVNHDHWWFLTGDRKEIYNYARNELRVTMQPGDGGLDDFIHSEKLVIIDRNRNIRGYYNGLDSADVKRCADDVILVTMEKEKRRK
ncbi:MAG TPA: SCO family protein [Flavipsychrobacter sp.]|nr:SCO family protein [Flavipsychrobacter sp.]